MNLNETVKQNIDIYYISFLMLFESSRKSILSFSFYWS